MPLRRSPRRSTRRWSSTATLPAPETDSELTVEFYLRPGLSKDEFDALVGTERLGRPIPGPFDAADPLANEAVEEQLRWRAQALFWLTQGLVQHLRGRPDRALELFDRAEQELRDWPDRDGKEILYFFQGREHFFLSELSGQDAAQQLDEAQRLFEKAVDLRPDYARARSALGSLHRRRAQQIVDPAAQLADPNLGQAIDLQEQALQDARAAQDPLLEALVETALAKSYRLRGDAHYVLGHDGEAETWLDRAISLVEQATPVLEEKRAYRVLAQAHETQGAAFTQQSDILRSQGDIAGAQESIRQAVSAYESCIAQGDKARFDEFLQEQVIAPEPTATVDQVASRHAARGDSRMRGRAGVGKTDRTAATRSATMMKSYRWFLLVAVVIAVFTAGACAGQNTAPTVDVNAAVQTAIAATRAIDTQVAQAVQATLQAVTPAPLPPAGHANPAPTTPLLHPPIRRFRRRPIRPLHRRPTRRPPRRRQPSLLPPRQHLPASASQRATSTATTAMISCAAAPTATRGAWCCSLAWTRPRSAIHRRSGTSSTYASRSSTHAQAWWTAPGSSRLPSALPRTMAMATPCTRNGKPARPFVSLAATNPHANRWILAPTRRGPAARPSPTAPTWPR